ncbi:MAG: 1,4-alpha-glucan branching protein GlgB [bacterium]|nr:1,4-alpha-glucan branching protein GlgB [bacterium]
MTETTGRPAVRWDVTRLTEEDLFLFNEGSHFKLYEKLGAHIMTDEDGVEGVYFAVWAPDAVEVSVIGDFNDWTPNAHALHGRGSSGIWEGFIPGAKQWMNYKYHIHSRYHGYRADKADPFAFHAETPPLTASKVSGLAYQWDDAEWMRSRKDKNSHSAPMSIYEIHIGSWMRVIEEGHRPMSYRELAPKLAEYVQRMGFTHVEFLPVMEHPFYGSWGYQITGFFAPTSRYGTPQDFMYLIDYLHQYGIGVILDWVPSHFPSDGHGLGFFDGTHLYEHADPRKGYHPDWGSFIFNYDRNEIKSFLYSNAFFWLDKFHADGLRVDAVASMLYLDYSRREGEWIPNQYGGKENIGAIEFLRRANHEIYSAFPDVQVIAEESTSWPMVSRPTYVGGLGFGYKWDMGWMHDSLVYFSKDPIHRKYHHNELTFRMLYAFTENFVLPLSHDEVVHGKGSLLNKMPGDVWQKFANLRLLFGYMYGQPGKKLIFMGGEIGQWREWAHDDAVEWHLLSYPTHRGLQQWVQDLNHFYRNENSAYSRDCNSDGFEWLDCCDSENSTLSFIRKDKHAREFLLYIFNFTPVPRGNYRIGVPIDGYWEEALNSDAEIYGGSGQGNFGGVQADPIPAHHHYFSLRLTLPPLGCLVMKGRRM